jgi:GDP-L-fucose synthase
MQVPYELKGRRVFVAGHRGMVGAALVRRLDGEGCEVLTASRQELDLRDQAAVGAWFARHQPDTVVLAAAKVGGIQANAAAPADFLYDNLAIETNVIHAAFHAGVRKLLFLGSSCIYPKHAPQPITEDALLSGALEPTNEWYAVAKIAGLKLAQAYRRQHGADFISAMPTNLYGPGDNFDLATSHVVPALLRRAHEAAARRDPALVVWGSGTPRREFLHVDDAASALLHLLRTYSDDLHVNVGTGEDLTILETARLIAETVGFTGELVTDPSKPDGTPRKLLDVSRLFATGWRPSITLAEGLRQTYAWYRDETAKGGVRSHAA